MLFITAVTATSRIEHSSIPQHRNHLPRIIFDISMTSKGESSSPHAMLLSENPSRVTHQQDKMLELLRVALGPHTWTSSHKAVGNTHNWRHYRFKSWNRIKVAANKYLRPEEFAEIDSSLL